ncbi:MAG: methyltransferase domain-containing protein [Minisyncoccia bacterium]
MSEKMQLGSVEIITPRELVLDALQYVPKGEALDLGSGWGRHSLYLASKGFEVEAVDSDPSRLASLERKSKESGLTVRAYEGDVRDFDAKNKQYDLILSTMVLHFLGNHEEMAAVVHEMQDATRVGGVDVICSYTDKSQNDLRPYLLNAEELKKLYADWEILHFKEFQGTDHNVDGPEKGKRVWRVELIARRK